MLEEEDGQQGARDLHPTVGRSVSVEEAVRHVDRALEMGLVPMVGHLMVDSKLFGMKRFDRFLTMCFCCGCCANVCPRNAINVTVSPDSRVLEELRSRVESRTRID